MFKKTRLRIFALIAAIATLIITLMLLVIYIATSNYSFERGISLLESYIDNNGAPPPKDFDDAPKPPMMGPKMQDNHNRMFNLSTFYSVFYNSQNEVVKVEYNGGVLYSEEEIIEIAAEILSSGKSQGKYSKMPFLVKANNEGTIVALIDNTLEMDNSKRLFEYCLIVGIVSLIVVLILSWIFSKKIVTPLEESDTKQKQFISDAGHELKTPISVISANADLLSMEIGDNKWLSNIQYENERMGILVKQLLNLVRAENMQQSMAVLDFSRLVSGGSLPFESVAYENGLELITEIENNINVVGNQNQLSQLVSILIDNAISHGGTGKDVAVSLSATKHNAILSVTNSGEPIPDDIKARLFERFYRVDDARTEDSSHFGLGLSIAKAIVTAHNGKIEINCDNGKVEFRISIPKSIDKK